MATEERSNQRRAEIDSILARKPGVREFRDDDDRYTVVGAANRETYANWLTPIEEHFVCHRNAIPEIDAESWTVSLSGALDGTVSMADLREFPTIAAGHTMECAGNGRGQHDPQTGSVQWGFEAAGTAVWTGTPVSSVLRAHGDPDPNDGWLTAIGGDPSEDDDVFARSIPLSKALDDCLLAYGMNGEALPAEHGHPVRLVVPGWYGVNSVKWLDELRIMETMVTEGSLDRPGTHAKWQQDEYRIHPEGVEPTHHETIEAVDTWDQLESPRIEQPYTFDQNVMSVIGTPDSEEPIRAGSVDICGVAWAGDAVEGVELSTDSGETWKGAEFFGPDYSGAWRLFRRSWNATPGTHTLVSRATDERGRVQPARISTPEGASDALENGEYPWNEGGYGANAYMPNALEVSVESSE